MDPLYVAYTRSICIEIAPSSSTEYSVLSVDSNALYEYNPWRPPFELYLMQETHDPGHGVGDQEEDHADPLLDASNPNTK